MHPTIATVASQYAINSSWAVKTLDGVTDDLEFVRPEEKANSANWIFGHILSTRYYINQQLGSDNKCEWSELYNGGVKIQDKSAYPSIALMKPIWESISAEMTGKIEKLGEEDLNAKSISVPNPEKNLRGVLTFFAMHETIHIGQIAYLRRLLGLDQVFG